MRSPAKVSHQLIVAVTSISLVGASLMAFGHDVEERHEVCAEHGELIHVAANGPAIDEADGPEIGELDLELEHGDHCMIAWSSPNSAEWSDRCPSLAPPVEADLPTATGILAANVGALYQLAPKTSPPVQA